MGEMEYTSKEVLQFIKENGILEIRLAFCDGIGTLRNISVTAEELPQIFQMGKTVNELSEQTGTAPTLHPDPATLVVLPWRPGYGQPNYGRVVQMFCNIHYPDRLESLKGSDSMDHILLVSSSLNVTALLADLLKAQGAARISSASHGGEARRLLSQLEYSLVIVNTPLEDEFGYELALFAVKNSLSSVMLLVKGETANEASGKVENSGVMVVPKPISRQMFYQALKLLQASASRIQNLKTENRKLQNKIEEIRMIDRAKCAMIQYLNMTEPQAHRYIEKQAMDLRVTKKEVARGILETYDI